MVHCTDSPQNVREITACCGPLQSCFASQLPPREALGGCGTAYHSMECTSCLRCRHPSSVTPDGRASFPPGEAGRQVRDILPFDGQLCEECGSMIFSPAKGVPAGVPYNLLILPYPWGNGKRSSKYLQKFFLFP